MELQTLTPVRAFTALPNQDTASNREGEIRPGLLEHIHRVRGQSRTIACICINQRGIWTWEPLGTLSSGRWNNVREDVAKSLVTSFNLIKPSKIEYLKKELRIKDEALLILKDLYGKLGREEKLAMLKTHKNTFIGRHTCRGCLFLCEKLTFCIHTDCTGLCETCAAKIKDTCLACGKKQKKECPICQEEKSNDDLMPSNTCRHCVCYKCYATAFQKGHPIWNCPLCRKEFTKAMSSHRRSHYFASDSEEEEDIFLSDNDDDDDDEWEDPRGFAALENDDN